MEWSGSPLVADSILLARRIRTDRAPSGRLLGAYWRVCLALTGIIEGVSSGGAVAAHPVLNFGCGNNFMDGAVNADLFAPHRALLRKRLPDLYWSGRTLPATLQARFELVVCEHVIEHLLPDEAMTLLEGLRFVLADSGVLVVSFPDLETILGRREAHRRGSAAVELNSTIYRHGHRFMYDKPLVLEMLTAAGFSGAMAGSRMDMPSPERLLRSREAESAYVTARKAAATRVHPASGRND
jgi:hypothetical protein